MTDDDEFGFDVLDLIRARCDLDGIESFGRDTVDWLRDGRKHDIAVLCPACNRNVAERARGSRRRQVLAMPHQRKCDMSTDLAAAKTLDQKIRRTADKSAINLRALLDLLEAATAGQIHVGLGYPSAAAYVFDAVQIAPAGIAQRKLLAALMSDRRLTPRVIAEAFDSSPSATGVNPLAHNTTGRAYTG
jgi:hypothetical protein